MKRVLTLDLLRGIAIIGVVLIHVLGIVFEETTDILEADLKNLLEGNPISVGVPLIVLGVVITFFGNFSGLFVMISAVGNCISVHRQWHKLVSRGIHEKMVFRKVLGTQTIRGGLVYVFGFISEGFLGNLLEGLFDDDIILSEKMVNSFFLSNILHCIGVSIIVTSILYLLFLRMDIAQSTMTYIMIAIIILIAAAHPFIRSWLEGLDYGDSFVPNNTPTEWPGNYIERGFWKNLLFIFLSPIIGRVFPLVPMFMCAAVGLIVAMNINEKTITPEFIKRTAIAAGIIVLSGILYGILLNSTETQDFEIARAKSIGWHTLILGSEVFSLILMIYLIDFRKKTNKQIFIKHTLIFRRFGMISLTLWTLQYFTVVPLAIFEIAGWPVFDGGLNGWQVLVVLFCVFWFWHFIAWSWEKGGFKGSFEWMMVLVLSRGSTSADRMKIRSVLHEPEGFIEWIPGKKRRRKEEPVAGPSAL
ncbi:hypothetical protein GF325_13460 [Candidatus Bathyarchaeota archaeon]|nr:hypothetical protein [Candidatus Bathyarchaeota archaeon]